MFAVSNSLSHIGATPRASAYAVAQEARANWERVKAMAAADRMGVTETRVVQPALRAVDTPAQIRAQVMADRGVDSLALMHMSAQTRIEAEISISAETAERARKAQIRTTGNFVDLRV